MSIDSAIKRYRQREEALFRSTCRVTRASGGEPTLDEETGDLTHPDPREIYRGLCSIRPAELVGSDAQAGEREYRLGRLTLKLPADTPVLVDDQVEVLSADYDGDLVGRTYRISDVLRDAWQVVRKATLEEQV